MQLKEFKRINEELSQKISQYQMDLKEKEKIISETTKKAENKCEEKSKEYESKKNEYEGKIRIYEKDKLNADKEKKKKI